MVLNQFLAIDFINGKRTLCSFALLSVAVYLNPGKVHANSLLATLNARLSLQIAGASTGENHSRTREVPLTNLRFADRARPGDSTDITMSQAGSGLNVRVPSSPTRDDELKCPADSGRHSSTGFQRYNRPVEHRPVRGVRVRGRGRRYRRSDRRAEEQPHCCVSKIVKLR
jgi:hypothetical protein